MSISKSQALFERAKKVIPGGVNSPVRAFRAVGGDPLFIRKAKGPHLWDADDNRYIDYVGSWGPMILGHADPKVNAAAKTAIDGSSSFGAPTEAEIELAEFVTQRVPSVDRLRLVSSGTEATMSAIRVARGFTKRDDIIKLEGCYHGHADYLLTKAGSGVATFGLPDSPGVPADFAKHTLLAPYNDLDAVKALFDARGDDIAGIILEPVAGNMGCILPEEGYLQGLSEITKAHGALLIFDEVMTGFRVGPSGAQGRFGITPDLSCFGKVIGGGMPMGAYGGRGEIMDQVAPAGPIYQAGTLSGNPCAVAAGIATLQGLDEDAYAQLESTGQALEDGIKKALKDSGHSGTVQRCGSMLTLFFNDGQPILNFDDAQACDHAKFKDLFQGLLQRGVYLPASGYESWFISLTHTSEVVEETVNAIRSVLNTMTDG